MNKKFVLFRAKVSLWLFSFLLVSSMVNAATEMNCFVNGYSVSTVFENSVYEGSMESEPLGFDGKVTVKTPTGEVLAYKVVIATYNDFNEYVVQAFVFDGMWKEAINVFFPSEEGQEADMTIKIPILTVSDETFDGYRSLGVELKPVVNSAVGRCSFPF